MGRPKWSLPFGDESMLERVVRTVSQVASPTVIGAGPFFDELQKLEFGPSVSVVPDAVEDFGPVAGLAAGFRKLKDAGFNGRVFVTGCDYPLLTPQFINSLKLQIGNEQILIPADHDHRYPLAGIYKMSVLDTNEQMLRNNDHRLLNLLERCETRIISVDHFRTVDPELHSLRNSNSPKEYRELLEIAGL